jgi:hypothetical protein
MRDVVEAVGAILCSFACGHGTESGRGYVGLGPCAECDGLEFLDSAEKEGIEAKLSEFAEVHVAEMLRLRRALETIREGMRSDGHLWIDLGHGGREKGPDLRSFVNEVLAGPDADVPAGTPA